MTSKPTAPGPVIGRRQAFRFAATLAGFAAVLGGGSTLARATQIKSSGVQRLPTGRYPSGGDFSSFHATNTPRPGAGAHPGGGSHPGGVNQGSGEHTGGGRVFHAANTAPATNGIPGGSHGVISHPGVVGSNHH